MSAAPAKRILVVDDDDVLCVSLKAALEKAGYQVSVAASGKQAQNLVGIEVIDAIVSDIAMPNGSGIELTHYVKRTKPVPVILMTGIRELSETQEAYELGADEFIPKPFKIEDLLAALALCFPKDGNLENKAVHDADYVKIGIEDFVSGREIQCDIYVRLSDRKYVKIAHEGENLDLERIRAYRTKNIRFLYMRKADFRKYVGFNLSLAASVKTSGKISKVKKVNFLKHTGELILAQLHLDGVDEESFDNAKTVVESAVSVLSDDKDALQLLDLLNTHADFVYAHSVGVSLYGSLLARQMRWTSPATLFKVAVGGLMHDIGKKELERALLMKPRMNMSVDEVKAYESHPTRGIEILGKVPSIPSDVLQIVLQHHETCVGQGYPSGLKKNQIHPMARLISVANEFCTLVLKGPNNPGSSPLEAIQKMQLVYAQALDPTCLTALVRLFQKT